jgi:hypothetical protein
MPLGESVERIGFRKWYERRLLTGHAHMVLAVLAVIALIGSLEAYRGASLEQKLLNVALVMACAVIGGWALRRYLAILLSAENAANQANCPSCGEYGRFKVVGDRAATRLQVRCARCQSEWAIEHED